MQARFFAAAASILLAPLGAVGDSDHGCHNAALTVRTTSGIYTGLVDNAAPEVYQWLGIPYGRPPLGPRRFLPPERAPYYGNADAKAYKPICFQDSGSKNNVFWQLMPQFQNTDLQNEDCLYLNIWAPRMTIRKKLPVIIWVCGGGFKEGGGHALYMVPDKWIQRTQTHLVVTINYRLNIFGFPGSPAAMKNAGLFDVRLAIEWLRDNIESFGGDPNRMILYGQSAGANIVLMYAYANPHNAIVRGFIASSSGTPTSNAANSSNFHIVAQAAGCANMSSTAELACMQNVDPLVLQQKVDQANPSPFRGLFRPLADNITAFSNLTDRLEKGLVSNLPLIAGFTYNEPAAFLDFDPSFTSPPPPSVPGTSGLACGIKTESIKRLTYGLTTYRYLFSGNFSNITPRYWLGGMHESDLPLVFGTHSEYRGNSTEFEWQTSFAMEDFWVSFAANPSMDPHHLNQTWPKFTTINGQVVVFGNATGPMGRASYIAPVELADKYSDPC